MQWGNGIMGSWGYVYKKEGWRHYWTWSKSKFRTLSYPLQTHADGRNDNNERNQTIKKKEFKIIWQSAHCAPVLSQCCRPSRRRRRGMRRRQRGVCSAPSECVFAIDDSTFAALNLLSLQVQFCLHAFSVDMAEHVRTARPNSTLVSLCYYY